MTIVRLENISKIFPGSKTSGPIQALDQVSLTIRHGQTMAIAGPSGGGKSTLLRIVAGRERNYGGDVFFDNRKMNAMKAKDRYLSMVFQDYARYPHFNGPYLSLHHLILKLPPGGRIKFSTTHIPSDGTLNVDFSCSRHLQKRRLVHGNGKRQNVVLCDFKLLLLQPYTPICATSPVALHGIICS